MMDYSVYTSVENIYKICNTVEAATILNNNALIYSDQGFYDKAKKLIDQARSIREELLGKEHSDTATTYSSIASVEKDHGHYNDAIGWYEKALSIQMNDPSTLLNAAATYYLIADVHDKLCNYDQAMENYQTALNIREKELGKNHPDTAMVYNGIANIYRNQENFAPAMKWYNDALKLDNISRTDQVSLVY